MLPIRFSLTVLVLGAFVLAVGTPAAPAQSEAKPWALIQTNVFSCKDAAVNDQMKTFAEARNWGAMRKLAGENCAPVPAQHQERLDYEQRDYCSAPAYETGQFEVWTPAGNGSADFRWARTETMIERPCNQNKPLGPWD